MEIGAREERLLFETFALRFGWQITLVVKALAEAMVAVAPICATVSATASDAARRGGMWMDDAYAAREMIKAARTVLDAVDPPDEAVNAAQPRLLGEPAATIALAFLKNFSSEKACEALEAILADLHQPSSLGSVLAERVQHHLTQLREQATAGDEADASINAQGRTIPEPDNERQKTSRRRPRRLREPRNG
jgi:hypothetical protein